MSICEVARATSAAPPYFKAARINEKEYLDGGLGGTNNPSVEIYDEVRRMNNEAKECVSLFVSIGTGKNNKISRWNRDKRWIPGSRYINYLNFAKKWVTESQTKHSNMKKEQERFGFKYYRLNVKKDLDKMKLDEWRARGKLRTGVGKCVGRLRSKTSQKPQNGHDVEKVSGTTTSSGPSTNTAPIETPAPLDRRIPTWLQPRNKTIQTMTAHTKTYLQDDKVKKRIEECAELLVECRRQRALKDPHRWEKACFGAWYQCRIHECPRGEREYPSEQAMRRHLLDKHRDQFIPHGTLNVDQALNESKILVH